MSVFVKAKLSGSTDNLPIGVNSTAGGNVTIHTGHTGTSVMDEVWLYAHNNHTAGVALTIEFGVSASAQFIRQDIPARTGNVLVIPGIPIVGNSTPKVISAYVNTGTANFALHGWVNRIDNSGSEF